jgi:transposase InsO family protein
MLWTAPPPEPGHKIYPYLLRGEAVTPPNQVWAMDIMYIPHGTRFRLSGCGARLVQSPDSVVTRVHHDGGDILR